MRGPNKQCLFGVLLTKHGQLFSSHHHHLTTTNHARHRSPPPTMLFTATDLRDRPRTPTTTNDPTATTTARKTKLTTHKQRRPPTYEPRLMNDGQQPRTDMGNNELR